MWSAPCAKRAENDAIALRVGRLIPMLSSDRDREIVAAAPAIGRTLWGFGGHHLARVAEAHLHDGGGDGCRRQHLDDAYDGDADHSARPPLDWRRIVRARLEETSWLDSPEIEFLKSLNRWNGRLTPKQWTWPASIADRVGVDR